MRCSAPLCWGRVGESKAHCVLPDTSHPTETCHGTKEAVTTEGGGQAADPQTLLLTAECFFLTFKRTQAPARPWPLKSRLCRRVGDN